MLNYYQPFLLPFLKSSPNPPIPGIKSYYYHSFEDALWDLIQHKFSAGKRLTILVPDFYCSDVLDNLKARGYKYIYYSLDADFQISTPKFRKYLSTFAPDIVIVFHACGILSNLFIDKSWFPELTPHCLIIEDSVHRLVDPANISLINNNHFIIDSLRKVSPLPGSRLFGTPSGLSFSQAPSSFLSYYSLSSFFYYLLFRLCLITGFLLNNSRLVSYSHNTILRKHDDIIGDSFIPHRGLPVFLPLIARFDYLKLRKVKEVQVALYKKYLSGSTLSSTKMALDGISSEDLHVYPLVFNTPPDENISSYLFSHNLPVWFKFMDTPWSRDKSVLFLPLGFHIKENNIKYLANLINNYLNARS